MEVRIDVDALRHYMRDYYGTAAFSGFPFAMADVCNVDALDGQSLCRLAEREGVDLRRFVIPDDNNSSTNRYGSSRW